MMKLVPLLGKNIVDSYSTGCKDKWPFMNTLFELGGYILMTTMVKTAGQIIGDLAALFWRYNMTTDLQTRYFRHNLYYKMIILDRSVDNPDERITNDVDQYTTLLSSTLTVFFTSAVQMIWYTYTTWDALSWYAPFIVFIFFLCGSVINVCCMYPTFGLWYNQEKFEGNFRFAHTHLREHAESIAFYNQKEAKESNIGRQSEYKYRKRIFMKILYNKLKIALWNCNLNGFTNLYGYVSSVMNYIVIALSVFIFEDFVSTEATPGEVYARIGIVSMELMQLLFAFTTVIQIATQVSQMQGYVIRLAHMQYTISKYEKEIKHENTKQDIELMDLHEDADFDESSGTEIIFRNVTLRSPSGPSGIGKTSILRILGRLWPYYEGTLICKPMAGSAFFYVPQNSYTKISSLAQQIIYPNSDVKMDTKLVRVALKMACLEYLVKRVKNLEEAVYNWHNLLSGGEKQRISFARFFYNYLLSKKNNEQGIKFLIMDESTNSMDMDVEDKIMEQVLRLGDVKMISVSHRTTLKRYHNFHLKINRNGTYDYSELAKKEDMREEEVDIEEIQLV